MDQLDDVWGATIDGAKLDLASGVLRLVLHRIDDGVERYWEVFVRGLRDLHLERHVAGRWDLVLLSEGSVTVGSDTTRIAVTLSSEATGALSAECDEIEVVEMGRVELS